MQKLLLKQLLFRQSVKGLKIETRRLGSFKKVINEDPDKWKLLTLEVDPEVTLPKKNKFGKREKKQLSGTFAFFESRLTKKKPFREYARARAKYQAGDVVYLAEPVYTTISLKDVVDKTIIPYWYEYDHTDQYWKSAAGIEFKKTHHRISSMFMCGFHARHFIKILDVRCLRLQYISEGHVMDEGLSFAPGTGVMAFAVLFDKINGIGQWDKNPWVWVYRFEYLKDYKISDNAKK